MDCYSGRRELPRCAAEGRVDGRGAQAAGNGQKFQGNDPG